MEVEINLQTVLGAIVATVLSPFITQLAKRWKWADRLATAVNAGVAMCLFVIAWAVTTGGDSEQLPVWMMAGLGGGHLSTVGYNVTKQARVATAAPPRRPRRKRAARKAPAAAKARPRRRPKRRA
ncbi:MAG TPA: hypothetical protein VNJ70_17920 [Thermoanaerobaculia bacterium]|nr:hypothetical protein [Thermoanaerobaculia bacterium]